MLPASAPRACEHDHRLGRLGSGGWIGFPLIVKPIAGAGSADTYRVGSVAELNDVLPLLRHVPEISVEEFVDGEEFTYDTVCAAGQVLFEHMLWYRPRPLQMRCTSGSARAASRCATCRCPTCKPVAGWESTC